MIGKDKGDGKNHEKEKIHKRIFSAASGVMCLFLMYVVLASLFFISVSRNHDTRQYRTI